MNANRTILKSLFLRPEVFILLGLFVMYFYTAPYTVQSGDTGELVTNSFFLRVAHPPGYPLWTLLYHLPIRYLPSIGPFHAASLFTILISLSWIALLLFKFKNTASFAVITVLATSLVFWRYSVLPDVFSLHLFFICLLYLIFLKPQLLEKKLIIFFMALCVAHHHTIVFCFPMYVYAVSKGNFKKKILHSCFFGALSFSFYFILMLFHPNDYGSWGNLNSVQSVLDHFLRREYGTFRLAAQDEGSNPAWLHLFGVNLLTNSWSILVALLFVLVTGWKKLLLFKSQFLILILCFLLYCGTFLVAGIISLDGFGETVFERFLLQPTILIFFFLLMAINVAQVHLPRWLVLCFLVNTGLNVGQNFNQNNYRNNTLIEDYTLNIFTGLPAGSIYYSFGDTQGWAAYYVHDVLKIRPDVVLLPPTLTLPWSIKKVENMYPDAIKMQNDQVVEGINFDKYSFFVNVLPSSLPEFHQLTYWGVIYEIAKSAEARPVVEYKCDIAHKYSWRSRAKLEDFSSFEVSRYYDLEYGRCHYSHGLYLLHKGMIEEAVSKFEQAVAISPNSSQFQERLCYSYKMLGKLEFTNCIEKLEELLSFSSKQYYLYKYE